VVSLAWSFDMAMIMLLWLLGLIAPLPPSLHVPTFVPQWNGVVLGMVCMSQFLISLLIDRRYEARVGRNYYWMIWYPLVYWMLTTATSIVALPKAILKRKGTLATWTSPDRGIQ
jgi:biofilm PGA synthesis N-glycosyltransferase PgaC